MSVIKYARGMNPTDAVVQRAAATLGSQNVYDDPDEIDVPSGVQWAVFMITYVSATALGGFKFKVLGGNGAKEGALPIVESLVAINQPFSQQTCRPGEYVGPVPGNGQTVTYPVQVRCAGLRKIRLLIAEVTTTAGNAAVDVNFA